MITRIEQHLCDRLRQGMGDMVREVASYSGEMDDDLGRIISAFPAAWVTFGGLTKSEYIATDRRKVKCTGTFVVIVGDYNTRDDESARFGGVNRDEVGTYRLIHAVRRLTTGQDLGLKITPFMPLRVRTLYNTQVQNDALSVFACEFETQWIEPVLGNGLWPEVTGDINSPDYIFNEYRGKVTAPDPDLLSVGLRYKPPGIGTIDDPVDLVLTGKKP
ncbi:DUF1834 family protein [Morganella morganii]|uniref:DUF1834 family protein n=1 Tax=Morganella morganii TaxID=582 RepID=UPI00339CCC03